MNNVYVGKRYVPIVAGAWQAETAYETLTIVTYQGSGYISKKDVPPNVLPTDTSYWALMYQGTGTGDVVTWDDIIGKPESYPTSWEQISNIPTEFSTTWDKVSGKPSTYPAAWGEIQDKPESFPTSWNSVSGKPDTFPTAWDKIQGKPENFPVSWDSVTGKPATYPPSAHKHNMDDVTGLGDALTDLVKKDGQLVEEVQSLAEDLSHKADKDLSNVDDTTFYEKGITAGLGAGSEVSWDSIKNKPETFPPSSHKHAISDVTDLQTTINTINNSIQSVQNSITAINGTLNSYNIEITNLKNTTGKQTIDISNLQSNQTAFNNTLSQLASQLSSKANTDLANVSNDVFKAKAEEAGVGGGTAGSVDWADVQNKPETFPSTWETVSGKPDVFPTNWENVSGKPATYPTAWGDITDKPETFPPSAHTHPTSDVTGLDTKLSTIDSSLSSIDDTLTIYQSNFTSISQSLNNMGTQITNLGKQMDSVTEAVGQKMNNPTNAGSSGQWLKRYSASQGQWASLPNASGSQAGLMSRDHYVKVDAITNYIVGSGEWGDWYYRLYSDNMCECWINVYLTNVKVNIALGPLYRSNNIFTQTAHKYPWEFVENPNMEMIFISTNNAGAFVWPNPVPSLLKTNLPQAYLVRPNIATNVTGYMSYHVWGKVNR